MSKLKTKKNKSRVLIAIGGSLAGTLAVEAAILFVRAGFEVRAAFIDGGENWASDFAVKSVCSHGALSASNRPGWSFFDDLFDLTVVVSPSSLTCTQLKTGVTSDFLIDFILKKSRLIRVLLNENTAEGLFEAENSVLSACLLPKNPSMLSSFYQGFFAACTAAITASKKAEGHSFYLSYNAPQELSALVEVNMPWLERLRRAFYDAGFVDSPSLNEADAAVEAYCGPFISQEGRLESFKPAFKEAFEGKPNALRVFFVPPSDDITAYSLPKNTIAAQNFKNKLVFVSLQGVVRVVPNLTGKSAYEKFCSYISAELSRAKAAAV